MNLVNLKTATGHCSLQANCISNIYLLTLWLNLNVSYLLTREYKHYYSDAKISGKTIKTYILYTPCISAYSQLGPGVTMLM